MVKRCVAWSGVAVVSLALAAGLATVARATGVELVDRLFFTSAGRTDPALEPQGRALGMWFVNSIGPGFTVDTRRLSVALACTHFCQGGDLRALPATDRGIQRSWRSGDDTIVQASVPIPDDVPWGIYRVRDVDARDALRSHSGNRAGLRGFDEPFVSIPPVPDPATGVDEHLRDVRNAYVDRTVQGFGPLTLDCDDSPAAAKERARDAAIRATLRASGPKKNTGAPIRAEARLPHGPDTSVDVGNEPSFVVIAIDRPTGPTRAWKIGGPVSSRETGESFFVSVSPLRVSFASKTFARPCTNPHLWLADAWEVRRTLWIHAPVHVAATTPVAKGMSRDTVAHILGYPSEFGTVEELDLMNDWHYLPIQMPFDSTVHFRGDKVSAYDPPGSPP